MTRFALFLALAAAGCNQCGERPHLLSRVRDRFDGDHHAPACTDGQLAGRGTGFGNPSLGYPVGNGTPLYGTPAYPTYPTYPAGDPYPAGPSRADELPQPGGYGTPYAQPRGLEQGRTAPRPSGLTTGKQ